MGNCLDIPPPQEKRAPHREIYLDRQYIRGASRPASVASGASVHSLSTLPVPGFQPYGMEHPLIAIDPATGRKYVYEPKNSPFVIDPSMFATMENGHYGGVEKTKHSKSHHHKSRYEKRNVNGESKDENDNIKQYDPNVVSITTFPDPKDDIVKRGSKTIISTVSPHRPSSQVVSNRSSTSNKEAVVTTTTSETVITNHGNVAEVIITEGGQDIVNQIEIEEEPIPIKTGRGSTYVTYIEEIPDPPRPPTPPPVVEEIEVTTTEEVVESTTAATEKVVTETTETIEQETLQTKTTYVEEGGIDDQIIQLYIDEPFDERPSKLETTVTSEYITTDSLVRYGISQKRIFPFAKSDLVISYASCDASTMWSVKREIENIGISVWTANSSLAIPEEDIIHTAQAIIDAQLLVVLLSKESVKCRHIRDQVALAHISNTSVFPVAVDQTWDVLAAMDTALKLQLASYRWTEMRRSDEPVEMSITSMVYSMKEELEIVRRYEVIDEDYGQVSSWATRHSKVITERRIMRSIAWGKQTTAAAFWDRYFRFPNESYLVTWERFKHELRSTYREQFLDLPRECVPHLMETLRRELTEPETDQVSKAKFVDFCSELGTDHDVWERVQDLAREMSAISEVFEAQSSVRVVALENIDIFGNTRVISSMRELIKDKDHGIRAVTLVSLSRCMAADDKTTLRILMSSLNDDDPLIREAACLAMGNLRADEAVDKLLLMWRHDIVPRVREAAGTALTQIGGEHVKAEMEITRASLRQRSQKE